MAGIENDIKTAATGIKRASGDQGSAEVHSLSEQIAADKYVEGKKATRAGKNPLANMRFRIKPPGAAQ
jgi:hypothetical protein